MATYVLIEHKVHDFETFRKVFENDGERRERLGSQGGQVFRAADDPNDLFVYLQWSNVEDAQKFAGSLELQEAFHWATSNVSTPRVMVLEHAMDAEM